MPKDSTPMLAVAFGQFSDAGRKAENQDHCGARAPTGAALLLKGITLAVAAAYRAFRDGFSAKQFGKGMSNVELDRLMDAFLENVPHLRPLLFTDQGIRLMNLDSQITEQVHRHFTEQGVPVLSVHDSYIIDYTRVGELKLVMAQASAALFGVALPTTYEGLGLDEGVLEGDQLNDYVTWRQTARSEGYLCRLALHEKVARGDYSSLLRRKNTTIRRLGGPLTYCLSSLLIPNPPPP